MGYLLIDPETGSGAYKIGSGENGADIDFLEDVSLFIAGVVSKWISSIAFLWDSFNLIETCMDRDILFALISVVGVFIIGLTMMLGFIWVAAVTGLVWKILTSLIFSLIVATELTLLNNQCRK